jgi:hypothetical protein
MAHEVFISYSSRDRGVADAICAALEGRQLRCWIAPRDIVPGVDWSQAIIDAIAACDAMVLVFSSNANQSEQVKREVSFAVSQAKVLVPVRIEDVQPSGSMLYFLGTVHWLEASRPPLEVSLHRLGETIAALLRPGGPPAPPAAPAAVVTPAPPAPLRSLPPRNSLGHVMVRLGDAHLPAGLPSPLAVGSTCVSNGDYLKFVRAGGPEPRGSLTAPHRRTWRGKACPDSMLDHPVLYVPHGDAVLFCDWLTETERLAGLLGASERYALPTQAQWHAFARGTRLPPDIITDRQWLPGKYQPTEPVSWGEPSASGLYHLFGNVFEWCADTAEKNGERYCLALGGGWASSREWLAQQVKQGTCGAIWRRGGLPMKDGGFRVCLIGEGIRSP